MERGRGEHSAVYELKEQFGVPVIAIATIEDLLGFLGQRPDLAPQRDAVTAYRERYGAAA